MLVPAFIRSQFPVLDQEVYGKSLVYFDNAATTQKPLSVITAMQQYYALDNANVHRGIHALSYRADKAYEKVREKVKSFIHANSLEEIIFTDGTTDAINLLAHSFGDAFIRENDEIIITTIEHHANIVPWQMLCERTGAVLRVVPVNQNGLLDLEKYQSFLSSNRTKLVSVSYISNVLGIVNPIEKMIAMAHEKGAAVLIDAAQAVAHQAIDVEALDCDFLVFSAHKMYGPTGVGVLYGKKRWLDVMPPYRGGGAMIHEVSFQKTTYAALPYKFEAGTPPISAVIGMGAAIDFIKNLGLPNIAHYEKELSRYLWELFKEIKGVNILGEFQNRIPLISFTLDDIHAHDIATILDRQGIAVRAGHHCAMPLMERFNVSATTRVSLAVYNTCEEIDHFMQALTHVKEVFL